MKKFLVGVVLGGAMVCGSAHADEASKRAKIDQLFALMHMHQAMNQMVAQTEQQTRDMIPGMFPDLHPTAAQQKQMDALQERVGAIARDSLDWKKIGPQFVDLYAVTYDEATVDGLLAFYKSPAGMTMIAKQPELIAKSQGITQQRMVEMQPKLRELFDQFMAEMDKAAPLSK